MLILAGAGAADFLYRQREGGFTQGNLSAIFVSKLEEADYVEIEKKFQGQDSSHRMQSDGQRATQRSPSTRVRS